MRSRRAPARHLLLVAVWCGVIATPAPAARREASDHALVAVDSLASAGRFTLADSLVTARLRPLTLRTLADSVRAAEWLVRRHELRGHLESPFAADTLTSHGARSLATALDAEPGLAPALRARAHLSAARAAMQAVEWRESLAHVRAARTWRARDPATMPGPYLAADVLEVRALLRGFRNDSAAAVAERAVALAGSAGVSPFSRAEARAWRAEVLRRTGKPALAVQELREALVVLVEVWPELDAERIRLEYGLAPALTLVGDQQAAADQYRLLLAKMERLGETGTFPFALLLGQLGGRERRLGELAAARIHSEQSVEVMRRVFGEQNQEYGFSNLGLGGVLREWGDFPGAERALRTALDVMAARMGAGHFRIGEANNFLAVLYREMDRPDSALACAQRALAIYRAIGDTTSGEAQNPRGSLAALLADAGRFDEAAELAGSAASRCALALGPDHNYVPSLLLVQAMALRAAGRTDEAGSVFDTVLVRRVRRYGHVHADVVETLAERGWLRARTGDSTGAWQDVLLSAVTLRRQWTILLRSLDEASAMALLLRPRWTALDLGISLAARRAPAAGTLTQLHDEVIRQRGLLLGELLLRRRSAAADTSGGPERRGADRLRAELARAVLSGDRRTDALLDSLARIERHAASGLADPRRADWPADTRDGGPGTERLRAALPPGAVLVSLVRHEDLDLSPGAPGWKPRRVPAYSAFLLLPEGPASVLVPLGRAARLDSLLDAWHRAVSRPGYSRREERRTGLALRRALLDPVLAHAPGVRDIYWVADGAFAALDPGTLPADDGRYLIEQPRLWYRLTTESDLLREPAVPRGAGLLAVGGVDFAAGPTVRTADRTRDSGPQLAVRGWDCENVWRGEFPALPGSRSEVLALADRWRRVAGSNGPAELLLAAQATEQAVRSRASGRRGLHLATHGFRLDDRCEAWSPMADSVHRMLFRSGLALAGANHWNLRPDPADDGLLTAGEISTLPLAGTEWACLSSCQGGLGDALRGEGAVGLVRAFRLAGVRRVLVSRWVVADEDAAQWNDVYYRGWLERGLSVDAAARSASLRLLAERRRRGLPAPPPTWACFSVEGEPD